MCKSTESRKTYVCHKEKGGIGTTDWLRAINLLGVWRLGQKEIENIKEAGTTFSRAYIPIIVNCSEALDNIMDNNNSSSANTETFWNHIGSIFDYLDDK